MGAATRRTRAPFATFDATRLLSRSLIKGLAGPRTLPATFLSHLKRHAGRPPDGQRRHRLVVENLMFPPLCPKLRSSLGLVAGRGHAVSDESMFESGAALADALASGTLEAPTSYVGMVKASDKDGHIAFAPGSCEKWIDVSVVLVGKVEILGHIGCRDHSHPLASVEFKLDNSDPASSMIRQLLRSEGKQVGSYRGYPAPDVGPFARGPMFPAGPSGLTPAADQAAQIERPRVGPSGPIGPIDVGPWQCVFYQYCCHIGTEGQCREYCWTWWCAPRLAVA